MLVLEILHVNNEILNYRKVGHGLNGNGPAFEIVKKTGTCQLWLAVYVGAATAAYAHSARPSVGEASVDLGLDVVEGGEHDHVVPVGDFVCLEERLRVLLRSIPCSSYCGYLLAQYA